VIIFKQYIYFSSLASMYATGTSYILKCSSTQYTLRSGRNPFVKLVIASGGINCIFCTHLSFAYGGNNTHLNHIA